MNVVRQPVSSSICWRFVEKRTKNDSDHGTPWRTHEQGRDIYLQAQRLKTWKYRAIPRLRTTANIVGFHGLTCCCHFSIFQMIQFWKNHDISRNYHRFPFSSQEIWSDPAFASSLSRAIVRYEFSVFAEKTSPPLRKHRTKAPAVFSSVESTART